MDSLVTGEETAQKISKAKENIKVKYNDLLFVNRDYEFSANKNSNKGNTSSVKGNLKSHISYWREIGANETILEVVENGYKIPFLTDPQQAFFKNNKSAISNSDFVEGAILELLDTGRIRETDTAPFIVNPLSVSTSRYNKKRLILDLRHVNKHVYKQKIVFDDWKVFSEYIEKEGFLFKFDIKQGYHHIDIAEQHQKYLGFSWEINGRNRYFVFTVLPFGLTSAPFIFTKVMRVLVKHWRENCVRIACFIDDGAGVGATFEKTKKHSYFVKNSLQLSGFIVNEEKSIWFPTEKMTWLGINVDLNNKIFTISDERLHSAVFALQFIINSLPYCTARILARFCGKIISMKFVMGDIVQLKTRRLYFAIESRVSWDSRIKLSEYNNVILELFFWKKNLFKYNSKSIIAYSVPRLIVCSDASDTGLAAYLYNNNNLKVSFRNFSPSESQMHSTWRELFAIRFSLDSLSVFLKGKAVLWKTDNYACSLIVKSGSGKQNLQTLSEEIHEICQKENINLETQWVPRETIPFADKLSRYRDTDNWEITGEFFNYLEKLWGPFTIDRFADSTNKKLKRFNSKFYCPGTECVDTFTVSWFNDNNLLVPPVHLIPRVIKHMKICKASGTIVTPYWVSAPFWPVVANSQSTFKSFVKDFRIMDNSKYCVSQGKCKKCFIGSSNFKSKIIAMKIEF